MKILKSLLGLCTQHGKKVIVIGGHALNAHGVIRSTGDLDLMVLRDDADFWLNQLSSVGYFAFNRTTAFIQFKAPDITSWPIDLMLVDRSTFELACEQAIEKQHGEVVISTASIMHLIAMKLHALKNQQIDRFKKDESDLLRLLDICGISLDSEVFRQLCAKYGTMQLYERLVGKEI